MEPGHETWRAIDPVLPSADRTAVVEGTAQPDQRVLVALIGLAALVVAAVAAVLLLGTPHGEAVVGGDSALAMNAAPIAVSGTHAPGDASGTWLIDVEGAVRAPGLYRLPVGSRVGDAVSAAGGYGPRVDAAAVASTLNLAAQLQDGAKVVVPERTDGAATGPRTPGASGGAATGGGTSGSAGAGLIDLNRATSAELDTLYGIGPATASKILASREQQPFTSVDELLSRKLVRSDVFAKIKDLVTVGG